jgi:nucleotide-binding universal stress UspA family protein
MNARMIVVGIDGSPASLTATGWAAREAYRRDAALHVVLAYHWTWPEDRFVANPSAEAVARRHAEQIVATTVEHARAAVPGLQVHGTAIRGEPGRTLIDAASHAALLVVGNRGHGGFANLMLGSTSLRVATRAKTPVIVVRGRTDVQDGPIVVGVGHTSDDDHALDAAFEAATVRSVPLIAVRAYDLPLVLSGYGIAPAYVDPAEIEAEERESLAEAVAPWRDKYPNVAVEMLVARGSAADALIGVSHTAQLVVVGTRGHGGFAGLLLGSVGQQLLHHAECPVLVVRP